MKRAGQQSKQASRASKPAKASTAKQAEQASQASRASKPAKQNRAAEQQEVATRLVAWPVVPPRGLSAEAMARLTRLIAPPAAAPPNPPQERPVAPPQVGRDGPTKSLVASGSLRNLSVSGFSVLCQEEDAGERDAEHERAAAKTDSTNHEG